MTARPEGRLLELRKRPRVHILSSVVVSFSRVEVPESFAGDMEGQGTVVDLSPKGCGVLSDTAVEPGDHVSLSLSIPHQKSSITIDLATVRWARGGIFGLEFISLWPAAEERLRQTIASIAEAPRKPSRT